MKTAPWHRHRLYRIINPYRIIDAVLLAVSATLPAGCTQPDRRPTFTLDCGAVVRGDTDRRELALVFTGGDHGQATAIILDILAGHNVKASFFLTGGYLAVNEQRAQVPRMVAEGHYVGPHSHGHLLYCSWEDREQTLVSRAAFLADLDRNVTDLRALGALEPGQQILFIPPYEWFNRQQVDWAATRNIQLINFTAGSGSNRDWIPEGDAKFAPSVQIVADVLAHEQREPAGLNGFLLLLHLGSTRTDRLDTELDALIKALHQRGYTLLRVDELLDPFRRRLHR